MKRDAMGRTLEEERREGRGTDAGRRRRRRRRSRRRRRRRGEGGRVVAENFFLCGDTRQRSCAFRGIRNMMQVFGSNTHALQHLNWGVELRLEGPSKKGCWPSLLLCF